MALPLTFPRQTITRQKSELWTYNEHSHFPICVNVSYCLQSYIGSSNVIQAVSQELAGLDCPSDDYNLTLTGPVIIIINTFTYNCTSFQFIQLEASYYDFFLHE